MAKQLIVKNKERQSLEHPDGVPAIEHYYAINAIVKSIQEFLT
jgi:hypothetical protein